MATSMAESAARNRIGRVLAGSAELAPDAEAVLTESDRYTFRALHTAAKAVSEHLASGTRVVVRLGNDPASLVAVHAAWMANCSVVSAGALVPTAEVTRRTLETSASAVLEPSHGPGLTVNIRPTGVKRPAPDGEAIVMFTSGTTGTPKGASLTFDALRGSLAGIALGAGLAADGRPPRTPARGPRLVLVPIAHMGGFLGALTAWWLGKPVLMVQKFSAQRVVDVARRFRMGILGMTPAMVWELVQADVTELPGVDSVTVGTAALPEATRVAFEQKFGIPVLRNYGQTEFAGAVAFERQSDVAAGLRPVNTVGRIAPGVEVAILDEHGSALSNGSVGEIAARAASAMSGYLGADGNPVSTEHWLRTGDLGSVDDDGFVYVVGRVRDMVVCGGFNVYPAQVEAALNALAVVADSAVAGVSDDRLGEVPVAAVVLKPGTRADAESLRNELRALLAPYELPRRFAFVDVIPRHDTGKVDRDAVGRIVEAQAK